ncbi:mitochondrial outer membrane protein SLC25A46 [Aedes albopictus]|uniref:Mitochondrial carrier protein n=1 Tax=Aedes albopictus TaxID=7160 RepID=A0ABM1XU97_AEDAL|nr:solute carrier family 25 member 46 [Aedes albopictus]XP_029719096.1 solute carrier family 25 member 46-like [Aedes albopictus]
MSRDMAGLEEYERYLEDDEDQLDNIPRFQPTFKSPHEATHYQFINSERDLTLPLQKHKNVQPLYESPDDEISLRKYLGASVNLISLITENLLCHPFMVLRRQCQVHHNSKKYHIVPLTLVPVIVHLHQRQGVTTLWKGIGSVLLVRGLTLAVEDVVSKFTPWPKEVNSKTTLKQFGQHLLLKCISLATIVPFYSASLVETVQSDIASEKPGIFDVFREGASRLVSWSVPQKGRMLPIWALVGPSISLGISKYICQLFVRGISTRIMCRRVTFFEEKRGARTRDFTAQSQVIEVYSTMISLMTTEIIFYPFETILHRIQLQGTRTIIDNLDSGYSVVPILTSYEGVVDCYRQTIATEGVSGLYKGFGAMLLQFAAHVAVIRLGKWIITQISEIMSNKPPPKVAEYYNLDAKNSGGSASMSRSISGISSLSEELS